MAVEELSIYNLTITSDHRLKVNNEELTGDGSILPGDSESLLAWALEQVGFIQQDSDSGMALQIEDQRPDGYGTKKVTIPPRRSVLIGQLRERTGRDLSHITADVQRLHEETLNATKVTPEPPQAQEQWAGDGANWESPNAQADLEAPSAAPASQEQDAWEEVAPAPAQTQAPESPEVADVDDEPVLAPPPPLGEHTPNAPAKPALPTRKGQKRPPAEATPAPAPEETLPPVPASVSLPEPLPQAEDQWALPRNTEPESPAQDDESWPNFDEPETSRVDALMDTPEVTEREDISSKPVTYVRKRPELGEGEAQKIAPKPKKERSKPMIAALIVVSLIAAFFVFQFVQSRSGNSYAATCIDERTMVRQASDDGCKNEEASYYRWWYTPSGSEVPAVNQTVSQAQGTRIRPEEAMIQEGFAPEGGLYGEEAQEPAPEETPAESPSPATGTDAPGAEETGAATSTGEPDAVKSSAPPAEKSEAAKSSDGK